jgi:hypothetical protein
MEHVSKESKIHKPTDWHAQPKHKCKLRAANPGYGRRRRTSQVVASVVGLKEAKGIADSPAIADNKYSTESVQPCSASIERFERTRRKVLVFVEGWQGGCCA